MLQLTDVATIRLIERTANQSGYSYTEMMQVAGERIAEHARSMLKNTEQPHIMFLIGKGNNGGDGIIAANKLATTLPQATIGLYLVGERTDTLLQSYQTEAMVVISATMDQDRRVLKEMTSTSDLLVDALFGIGIHLPLPREITTILSIIQQIIDERATTAEQDSWSPVPDLKPTCQPRQLRVLAVDCPSGVDCDSGASDQHTIAADETITFILPKRGLFLHPATSYVGNLTITKIGIPEDFIKLCPSQDYLMEPTSVKALMPRRSSNSHKGTYGSGLIIAGSSRYLGAASLAAEAAYRSGSGVVTVATTQAVVHSLAGVNREATWIQLPEESGDLAENAADRIIEMITRYDALLLGPGIGLAEPTRLMVRSLLQKIESTIPMVIDADGLSLLSSISDWHKLLPVDTILTPHPGEMARLTGLNTQAIQQNRWEVARQKAQEWNAVIVLKGAQTVVASPDGKLAIAPFQTDALATAGTGDILAGIITGFLAQGQTAIQAAILAVYVHGLAGLIAAREKNTRSIIASDLLKSISQAFDVLEN